MASWNFLKRVIGIVFVLLTAPHLPEYLLRLLYTLSLQARELILFIIPLALWGAIGTFLRSVGRKAPFLLASIFLFEACSNASSTLFGCLWAMGAAKVFPNFMMTIPQGEAGTILPLWDTTFPRPWFWTSQNGALLGIAWGLLLAFCPYASLEKVMDKVCHSIDGLLLRVVKGLFPLLMLSVLLPLCAGGEDWNRWISIGSVTCMLLAAWSIYIGALYCLASAGHPSRMAHALKAMAPAGSIALTSCSGMATMPITIAATAKNLQDPSFANLVIPLTTHIQQVGDCLMNAFLSAMMYWGAFGHFPTLKQWVPFISSYVLARYMTAAMLGGAFFVTIPLYEHYLGFSKEMIGMLWAFNAILDPFVTASNVMGNGALAIVFEKVWRRLSTLMEKENLSAVPFR